MKISPKERIAKKYYISTNGCWQWLGSFKDTGYGQFFVHGKNMRAHRASYELHVGLIPEGMQLDHLCRNKGCINPSHLEVVTRAENLRRAPISGGHAYATARAKKTHCKRGHLYLTEKHRCTICVQLSKENRRNKQIAEKRRRIFGTCPHCGKSL